MFRLIIFSVLTISSLCVSAQVVTFNKLIDIENQEEQGRSVIEVDSGYVIFAVGNDFSVNPAMGHIKLVKTSLDGDTLLIKFHKDSLNLKYSFLAPRSFKTLEDGKSFGLNISAINKDKDIYDFHFFTFDENLDIKSKKVFSSDGFKNYARDFIETQDGGYLLAGYKVDTGSYEHAKALLVKTDSSGNTLWEKSYFSNRASANNIYNAYDGGYIFSGARKAQGQYTAIVVKIDSAGNIEWHKNYRDQYETRIAAMTKSSDTTYVISYGRDKGNIKSGWPVHNETVTKIDVNGNELWTYNFNHDYFASGINIREVSPGKGYVIIGQMLDEIRHPTRVTAVEDIPFILRLDNNGNLLWERRYAWYSRSEYFNRHVLGQLHSIEPTIDGGFICTGFSFEDGLRRPDIWLLKLDSLGCLDGYCGLTDTSCYYYPYPDCGKSNDTTGISDYINTAEKIKVYPNPAKDFISIEMEGLNANSIFYLYSLEGKRVLVEGLNSTQTQIDVSGLESGLYIYGIENNRQLLKKGRLVIAH